MKNKSVKAWLKQLLCDHQYETTTDMILYHIIEQTNSFRVKCKVCNKVKKQEFAI